MLQTVGKWGNNLAVRIPNEVTILRKGQSVNVVVKDDIIQIIPIKKRRTMAEILAPETQETHPGILVDFGADVGNEVLE